MPIHDDDDHDDEDAQGGKKPAFFSLRYSACTTSGTIL